MVVTCVVAGTVLAILAPYGTSNFTLLFRFIFWVGLCFAGGLGAAFTDFVLNKTGRQYSPMVRALWQSLGASIVVAAHLLWLTLKFEGPISFGQFALTFFYIWVIAITISGIGNLTARSSEINDESNSKPAIFERLPLRLRASEIYALAAEDHYVRVITSKGEDLILMRLSDAIKEISPLIGLSPHRSWWVAETGVEKLGKTNSKTYIELKSGQTVPVSRNGAKTIKAAGWR